MPTRLVIENLHVRFRTPEGEVPAVNGVDLAVSAGESVAVVGESGAGKSQIFLAIMGLLAKNGRAQGSVRLGEHELLNLGPRKLNQVRGSRLAMVFQDPMTSLNPYLKVGRQLTEVLVTHQAMNERTARTAALEMLERVRISEASRRFNMYPHEFSGGMRQRVMIAMALLCGPELLIADEPTTALDVTVQAEIMALLRDLQKTLNTAIVLITHDLSLVAGLCERVMVLYAGRIVEAGSVDDLFYRPEHPYTRGLLAATPRLGDAQRYQLTSIPGQPPNPLNLPTGCAFHERCRYCLPTCVRTRPLLRTVGPDHFKACHLERL